MSSISGKWAFEVGRLYYEKADFKLAIPILHEAASFYASNMPTLLDSYLACHHFLLHIYMEQEDIQSGLATQSELQKLFHQNIGLSSPKLYNALALSSLCSQQVESAFNDAQKSLSLALFQNQRRDVCLAITTLAMIYIKWNRFEEALKETSNLLVLSSTLNFPGLYLRSQLIRSHILYKVERYEEAMEVWEEGEKGLQSQKSLYFHMHFLYMAGMIHLGMGDTKKAHWYLLLAKKIIDPQNMIHLSRLINEALEPLRWPGDDRKCDLTFEESMGILVERHKGEIFIKHPSILMRMLKLFLGNPGQMYSKKDLASKVWNQNYNPKVHDNKIYVTIRRFRRMIEPDETKPRYIFKAKNGYYLHKSTKIHWQH